MKTILKSFYIILFLIISNFAFTDEIVIKCKNIIDVKTGNFLSGQFIFIKNNQIVKISKNLTNFKIPIIDLENNFILPGLIDSHAHLLMTQTKEDKNFGNALERESKLDDQFRIERAKKFLTQYLSAGFTTVFDLGNSGYFLDAKLKKEILNNSNYPSLFISGPGIATQNAQFNQTAPNEVVKKEYQLVNKNSNFNKILQLYINQKVDILKIYLDNIPGEGEMDDSLLRQILTNKKILQFKKVTFHSISNNDLNLISKFKIKNVEHFNFFSPSSKLSTVEFATPTDLTKETWKKFNDYNSALYYAQLNRTHFLKNSTIKILFGPDFYYHENSLEFNRANFILNSADAFTEAGLTPLEIIQTMTLNPVLSLHLDKEFGQLKTGQVANIIATKTNPLKNIKALNDLVFIMNQGKVIQAPKPRN